MSKMKKKYLIPLILVLIVSLALTGCANDKENTKTEDLDIKDKGSDLVDEPKDTGDDLVKEAEDNLRDMNYEDIKVKPEEAFDKFMELHPGAKINELDLDKELVEYQYVVEGYDDENSYEVKINPVDGEIISDDSEAVDLDDENGEITKEHLAKIDGIIEKAKEEDGSDSELDEWNISIEDGKVIMEVEIGMQEYSYDMDTEELVERDM